jgi:hypothetical protein
MELSILISGLIERLDRSLPLYYKLLAQSKNQPVEVLLLMDNRLAMPLDAKRNQLLKSSQGRFVGFIEDDDDVSDDYVASLLAAARETPEVDVLCFQQSCSLVEGEAPFKISTSLGYENEPCHKDSSGAWADIRRKPWHWCLWKGSAARQTPFVASPSEDWLWVQEMLKQCSTEALIEKVLYFYRNDPRVSIQGQEYAKGDPDRRADQPRFRLVPIN